MSDIHVPDPRPEVDCWVCDGRGWDLDFKRHDPEKGHPKVDCERCNATGRLMTEFGGEILDFMRKHLPAILKELSEPASS